MRTVRTALDMSHAIRKSAQSTLARAVCGQSWPLAHYVEEFMVSLLFTAIGSVLFGSGIALAAACMVGMARAQRTSDAIENSVAMLCAAAMSCCGAIILAGVLA